MSVPTWLYVVAGVGLLGALVGAAYLVNDNGVADQVEWSIWLSDDDELVLKGDLPNGFPTETWLNGQLLDREEAGDFSWDLQAAVPSPVSLIEEVNECEPLFEEMNSWMLASQTAPSRASEMRQLAFAQAAIERMSTIGCDSPTDEPGGGQ